MSDKVTIEISREAAEDFARGAHTHCTHNKELQPACRDALGQYKQYTVVIYEAIDEATKLFRSSLAMFNLDHRQVDLWAGDVGHCITERNELMAKACSQVINGKG